jgi:hypothetical protein
MSILTQPSSSRSPPPMSSLILLSFIFSLISSHVLCDKKSIVLVAVFSHENSFILFIDA